MRPRRLSGFGLVETLVALAIGLFLVACATALLQAARLDGRRSLAEQRVTQELRNAAEQITRNLRRAGHWGGAATAAGSGAADNPYAALATANGALAWHWSRDAAENGTVDTHERFGLRLSAGTLQFQIGAGGWQALTDPRRLVVTTFDLVPGSVETPLPGLCPTGCAGGDAACPPRHLARRIAVVLAAQAADDPAVQRRIETTVHLRNDLVVGRCS